MHIFGAKQKSSWARFWIRHDQRMDLLFCVSCSYVVSSNTCPKIRGKKSSHVHLIWWHVDGGYIISLVYYMERCVFVYKERKKHALSRLGDRCINFSYISRFFFFQLVVCWLLDYILCIYFLIFIDVNLYTKNIICLMKRFSYAAKRDCNKL